MNNEPNNPGPSPIGRFMGPCVFSPDAVHRYTLWRQFEPDLLAMAEFYREPTDFVQFIGLNPSTADDSKNDPTVRRCLCRIPAVMRFVSNEPALERIDWSACFEKLLSAGLPLPDWLITGGESGKLARDYQVEWGHETIKVCRGYGVTPFFKQTGSRAFGDPREFTCDYPKEMYRIRLKHPKGGDPEEWPESLRVQEIPKPRSAVHPHA